MTDTLGCARNGAFTRACPTSSPFALNTCIASRRHAAGRSIVSTSRASAPLERTLSALPPARQPKQLTSSTANSTAPFVPSATSKRRPAVAYTSTLRRTWLQTIKEKRGVKMNRCGHFAPESLFNLTPTVC